MPVVALVAPRVLLVVVALVLVASWVVLALVRVLVSRRRSLVGVSMWRLGLRMRMRMVCLRVM